ncbi:MAG: radical SAM protein, partial [Proteobacteria bacterium]
MIRTMIIKLTSNCNLACSYCYYVGHERTPKGKLNLQTLRYTLQKYSNYTGSEPASCRIYLHGGEPLLLGKRYIRSIAEELKLYPNIKFNVSLQTNGVLLDNEWIDICLENKIALGISLDGKKEKHDKFRVFPNGRGSYENAMDAINLMKSRDVPFTTLVVVDPDQHQKDLYDFLMENGLYNLDFLIPMANYQDIKEGQDISVGKAFIDLFDCWFLQDDTRIKIRYFDAMISKILTGRADDCTLNTVCSSVITLQPDGSVELCDDLSITNDVAFVRHSKPITELEFSEIETWTKNTLSEAGASKLPDACRICEIKDICTAGC